MEVHRKVPKEPKCSAILLFFYHMSGEKVNVLMSSYMCYSFVPGFTTTRIILYFILYVSLSVAIDAESVLLVLLMFGS